MRIWKRRHLSISRVLWWFVVGYLGCCCRMSQGAVRRFDLNGLYTLRWDVYLILSFCSVYLWFNFNHWVVEAGAEAGLQFKYNGRKLSNMSHPTVTVTITRVRGSSYSAWTTSTSLPWGNSSPDLTLITKSPTRNEPSKRVKLLVTSLTTQCHIWHPLGPLRPNHQRPMARWALSRHPPQRRRSWQPTRICLKPRAQRRHCWNTWSWPLSPTVQTMGQEYYKIN